MSSVMFWIFNGGYFSCWSFIWMFPLITLLSSTRSTIRFFLMPILYDRIHLAGLDPRPLISQCLRLTIVFLTFGFGIQFWSAGLLVLPRSLSERSAVCGAPLQLAAQPAVTVTSVPLPLSSRNQSYFLPWLRDVHYPRSSLNKSALAERGR